MSQVIEVDWDSVGDTCGATALRDLRDDVHRGYHARAVITGVNQERAARAMGRSRVTPLGMRREMVVDGLDFHYWTVREGLECWHDEQFLREKQRDVPATRVQCETGRTLITVPELPGKGGAA